MTQLNPKLQEFLNREIHPAFINGQKLQESGQDLIDVVNPSTEEVIAKVQNCNASIVAQAVENAHIAFQHNSPWRTMTPDQRGVILNNIAKSIDDNSEALAQLITLENGKLLSDAMSSDVKGASKTLRYYAGWTTKIEGETLDISQLQKQGKKNFSFTKREPVGVVAAIVPWNFPLSIAIWKIAPALAAGCTVVLKPSEETPLSALYLAELAVEAGLPAGVLNVVTGDGQTTGSALTQSPLIEKISFTGSTSTGKIIGQSAIQNLTELSLELGGKSPALVFDDNIDMLETAKGVAAGIFRNQGQVCVAGSRVYIQENIFDEFLDLVSKIAQDMQISDGFDAKAQLGPLVSKNHLLKVKACIADGLQEGAELISGGNQLDRKGYFLEPTIFKSTNNKYALVQEEIFGPVLVAVPFKDIEDAIEKANDNDMGLAATIWTKDISKSLKLIERLQAGLIYVNSPVRSDPNLPLGGYKYSGIGRELGKIGLYNFTTLKSVNIVY